MKKSFCVGNNVTLYRGVVVDALSSEGVRLGDNTSIGPRTQMLCTGTIRFLGKGISMGSGCSFGNDCFFGAAGGIVIGNDVVAGQYIRFHSENHIFDDPHALIKNQGVSHKGIVVGSNCWIGAGVVFLDGSGCGSGCVIGANSVVTKVFPDNCVIAGVPAKIIKKRLSTEAVE